MTIPRSFRPRLSSPSRFVFGFTLALAGSMPGLAWAQASCPPGMALAPNSGGVCCWPGQSYDASSNRCVGVPSCSTGFVAQGDQCVAATVAPGPQPQAVIGTAPAPPPAQTTSAPMVYAPVAQPVQAAPAPTYGPSYTYVTPRPQPRRRRGLMAGGAALLGVGYIGAIIEGTVLTTTCGSGCSGATVAGAYALYIPLLGPWITLIAAAADGHWPALGVFGTGVLGAFEVSGFAMLLVGARRQSIAFDDRPDRPRRHVAWMLYPTASADAAGVGFTLIHE